MELEIFNIQSEQQQQRDDNLEVADLQSCPPSVRTANLLFVEVIHLGHQNQKRLMHAINGPCTNIRPALLAAVDTCTHWVPIFCVLLLLF